MQLTRRLPPEIINCKAFFSNHLQLTNHGGSRRI